MEKDLPFLGEGSPSDVGGVKESPLVHSTVPVEPSVPPVSQPSFEPTRIVSEEKSPVPPLREETKEKVLPDTPSKKEGLMKRLLGGEDPKEAKSASFLQAMGGDIGLLGEYYFPSDLIGGCCPRVVGSEQQIVWHAAAEASDSERIHLIWQAKGDKIWYLAVRSSEMSSHANTWCPFASLLPGMEDESPLPACYTYYSEETATMMTITEDGLQIHRGTSSVVRAKADRVSRTMNDLPIVELFPDRIERLKPVPWFSLSLFEDRVRRVLAVLSVVSAIGLAGLALFVWFIVGLSVVTASADLESIQSKTKSTTERLLRDVQELRRSPVRKDLAAFSALNDGLLAINGWLEFYSVENGKILWSAVVPLNVTADRIRDLGGKTLETRDNGVVIGNSPEALKFNDKQRRR